MPRRHKTNAMRMLESHGVQYGTHRYSPELKNALDVAAAIGATPEQVFKTLVVVRERGKPLLVMVPAERELDLKTLAKAIGEKKLHMATQREAEKLTGLRVGGISALGLVGRGFDVFADESVRLHPKVFISAGRRGVNLSLEPDALVRLTSARTLPTYTE
jgi:Cys-tRNA(Pro)/Cys-tRNA(Cys) deacylase